MAEDSIGLTSGTDEYLQTYARTIASQERHAQMVLLGESGLVTYSVRADNISIATSADHILFVQSDGTNYTRIKRIAITPTSDIPVAASVAKIELIRTTSAGTGGSAVTPRPYDSGDAAYGGTCQTLPTAKGGEGATLYTWWLPIPAALGDHLDTREWVALPGMKPFVFGTAAINGFCFKIATGIASATVSIMVEVVTTAYL